MELQFFPLHRIIISHFAYLPRTHDAWKRIRPLTLNARIKLPLGCLVEAADGVIGDENSMPIVRILQGVIQLEVLINFNFKEIPIDIIEPKEGFYELTKDEIDNIRADQDPITLTQLINISKE